jgi:hypothetical protein
MATSRWVSAEDDELVVDDGHAGNLERRALGLAALFS